jgi:hypothetical protein
MFDALNFIHDIALKGRLNCECGSSKIELVLLSDCILIKCAKCGSEQKIPAATNKDLKEILTKNQIFIDEKHYAFQAGNETYIASRQSADKYRD